MYATRTQVLLTTATLAVLTAGGAALATTEPHQSLKPAAHLSTSRGTPDQCIRRNGGDWNACNVGNSGYGDTPYRASQATTPNECIRRNGGDWNACNVGNSGYGGTRYLPLG